VPSAAARKSLRRLSRSTTTGRLSRSRTETLAPARAPRCDHLAAACGRHARAETVPALAHQFARLVGSFHGISPLHARPACVCSFSVKHKFQRGRAIWRGLYGTPPGSSMRRCRTLRAHFHHAAIWKMYDKTTTPVPGFRGRRASVIVLRHLG
jgi:hypothetical protein